MEEVGNTRIGKVGNNIPGKAISEIGWPLDAEDPQESIEGWIKTKIKDVTLLHNPRDYDNGGFDFIALQWVTTEMPQKPGEVETERFEILMHGIAYFDGIRHLYFGEEDGYVYYANVVTIAKVLEELRRLEKTHCNPGSINKD